MNMTWQLFSVGLREWGFIASGVSGRRNLSEAQSERRREEGKGTERRRESQTVWMQGKSWNSELEDRHIHFSFILWTHRACGWMDMLVYTGCLQEPWGLIILTNGANIDSSLYCKFPPEVTASVLDRTLCIRIVYVYI